MGNKFKKPTTARRAASFLAVLGALVMSSGVALMVTATPANADPSPTIVVCKYVSTPGGVLQGGNNPIEPNLNSIKAAVDDDAWVNDPNRTFPKSWGDAQGGDGGSVAIGYAGQGLTIADCPGQQPEPQDIHTTAGVTFTDPTCTSAASYAPAGGSGVDYAVTSGSVAAGSPVTVTATPQTGYVIDGQTAFNHTFTTPSGCQDVSGPKVCDQGTDKAGQEIPDGKTPEEFCNNQGGPTTVVVSPPKAHTPKAHTPKAATVTTPTVVHAGLASVSTQDLRGEQGLALMVAGMVMLVAAGGLGLRLRGVASRI